eukprot:356308_1
MMRVEEAVVVVDGTVDHIPETVDHTQAEDGIMAEIEDGTTDLITDMEETMDGAAEDILVDMEETMDGAAEDILVDMEETMDGTADRIPDQEGAEEEVDVGVIVYLNNYSELR